MRNAPAPPRRLRFGEQYSTQPVCLRWHGRTIAKLVRARPGGELVLAMPYRNRQTVEHVSIPPAVLAFARQAGARRWIVRLDELGECYELALDEVERRGWLKPHRDGWPELFVPLSAFRPCAWLDWDYVEQCTDVDDAEPAARQLALWPAEPAAGGMR